MFWLLLLFVAWLVLSGFNASNEAERDRTGRIGAPWTGRLPRLAIRHDR